MTAAAEGNQVAPSWWRRARSVAFVLLLLGGFVLLLWVSQRWSWQVDVSASGRNTLGAMSQETLQHLAGPLKITAFVEDGSPLRRQIGDLVARYQRYKHDIELSFVVIGDKLDAPDSATSRTQAGDLLVEYKGVQRTVRGVREVQLTSALVALARGDERWLVFVTGHGERDPLGEANFDLGLFGKQLVAKGFRLHRLNLAALEAIPDNTATLVIASPQVDWLPGEVALAQDYLAHGGNVLWLQEPQSLRGLAPLATQLGVEPQVGLVIDPDTQRLGIKNPALVLAASYGRHPITQGFNLVTVFPFAAGLGVLDVDGWHSDALAFTSDQSWIEQGSLAQDVSFDKATDIAGPATLAVALNKPRVVAAQQTEQRVVVVGDGDFLSNAYLGNGGNLELGLRMMNWLSHDDELISLSSRDTADSTLTLSTNALAVLGFGLLVVAPALMVTLGFVIGWRRNRR